MRIKTLLAALTIPIVTAVTQTPVAGASTDCSRESVAQVIQATDSALSVYFDKYPEANEVITDAYLQPESVGASNIKAYFAAHPQQNQELQEIMAPIDEKRRECRTV
jgi:heme-binding protein